MQSIAPKNITQTETVDIQRFLSKRTQQGYKERSLLRTLSSLKQFFAFLVEEKLISGDPTEMICPPKAPRTLPKTLSKEEMGQLANAAQKDTTPEGIRLLAFLELLYATGMRVSELVSLKLSAIHNDDEENVFLYVKGKRNKERVVFLTPSALTSLKNYLSYRDFFLKMPSDSKKNPYFFPSSGLKRHMTRQWVGKLLKKLAATANLDPSLLSPHVIRHAFATHLLEGGADLVSVQHLLGHTDISTTQIYTHVTTTHLQNTLFTKHPLMSKNKTLGKSTERIDSDFQNKIVDSGGEN